MNKPVIKNKIKSLSERKNVLNNTNNFISGLKLIIEGINNDYFRIPDKFYAKPLGDVDASWMADYDEYEDAANDIEGEYSSQYPPQQMLARLPILLAQLQAGNNSQKLKYEIRQLLYSLYRSKKINKLIYEHLVGII